jgi:hypothetical protein
VKNISAPPSQFARNSPGLPMVVKQWPTPNAAIAKDRGNLGTLSVRRRHESGKQMDLSMVVSDDSALKLHGRWTLALMGFPPDWCDDLPPDPLASN